MSGFSIGRRRGRRGSRRAVGSGRATTAGRCASGARWRRCAGAAGRHVVSGRGRLRSVRPLRGSPDTGLKSSWSSWCCPFGGSCRRGSRGVHSCAAGGPGGAGDHEDAGAEGDDGGGPERRVRTVDVGGDDVRVPGRRLGQCLGDRARRTVPVGQCGGQAPCEPGGEHGAHDGDAEGAAEFAGGGLQSAGDARLLGRQPRRDLLGETRQCQGDADADEQQPARVDGVGPVRCGREAEQAARGGEERGGKGHGTPGAGDEARDVPSPEQQGQCHREDAESGAEHAEAAAVLQQRGVDVEQAEVGEERDDHADARRGQEGVAEEPRVEHGMAHPQLDGEPCGGQSGAECECGGHERTRPSALRALDDGDEEGNGRRDEEKRPGRVEPALMTAAVRHGDRGPQRAGECDEHDGEEQCPPRSAGQERPSPDVADHAADAAHACPHRECAAAVFGRCGVDEDADAVRQYECGADSGEYPTGEQDCDGRCQGGQRRSGGDGEQAGEQDALASEAVAGRAAGDDETGEDDDVAVHDPEQFGRGGVQIAGREQGDREVDRGHKTDHERGARAHAGEDDGGAARGRLWVLGRGVGSGVGAQHCSSSGSLGSLDSWGTTTHTRQVVLYVFPQVRFEAWSSRTAVSAGRGVSGHAPLFSMPPTISSWRSVMRR
ncbi:hypothetical protein SGPA1_21608 [Streptomyces misionensis JCM 4497]